MYFIFFKTIELQSLPSIIFPIIFSSQRRYLKRCLWKMDGQKWFTIDEQIFQSVTRNMDTFWSKSCTRCETRRISARNPTTRWWRVGTRFSTSNFLLEEGPMCRDLRMQNGNRNSRCVLTWVTTLWRERCRTTGSRFDSRREIVSCVWNDRGERHRWRLWTEIQRRWGLSEGEYRGLETKFEYKFFCWKNCYIFSFLPLSFFLPFPLASFAILSLYTCTGCQIKWVLRAGGRC